MARRRTACRERTAGARDDDAAATDDLWETHADWWNDGFTDGADPEYEEQILPLAAARARRRATGARRRAAARARSARLAVDGRRRAVVGVDPTWNQIVEAPRARRGTGLRAAPAPAALPFADGSVRRRGRLPGVRAHRRRRRGDRRGRPRARARAGGSASSSTTRCCRRRTAAGSTTRSSTRPSSTGGSARTSSRTRRSRRWRRACSSRSSTGRSVRYVNALADARARRCERMDEPAPPPGFLARARRVRGGGDHPAPAVSPRCDARSSIGSRAA